MTRSISSSFDTNDENEVRQNQPLDDHHHDDDDCLERMYVMFHQERNGGYWMRPLSSSSSISCHRDCVDTATPSSPTCHPPSQQSQAFPQHQSIPNENICPVDDDDDEDDHDHMTSTPTTTTAWSDDYNRKSHNVPCHHPNGQRHKPIETTTTATTKHPSHAVDGDQPSIIPHHHHPTQTASTIDIVDCRTKMIVWCYELIDFCRMKEETVEIAVSMMDRFMNQHSTSTTEAKHHTKDAYIRDVCHSAIQACWYNKKVYQLMTMSALYIAIKMNELMSLNPKLIATKLSRNTYTSIQIENMEAIILETLAWKLHVPTIASYCHEYQQYMALSIPLYETWFRPMVIGNNMHHDAYQHVIQQQIKLAILSYDFITMPKSVVAYCCIVNAIEMMYHRSIVQEQSPPHHGRSYGGGHHHHHDQQLMALLQQLREQLLVHVILHDISPSMMSLHEVEQRRHQLYDMLLLSDHEELFFHCDIRRHHHHVVGDRTGTAATTTTATTTTQSKPIMLLPQHTPIASSRMIMMMQDVHNENIEIITDALDISMNGLSIIEQEGYHHHGGGDAAATTTFTEKGSAMTMPTASSSSMIMTTITTGIIISPSSAIVTTAGLS